MATPNFNTPPVPMDGSDNDPINKNVASIVFMGNGQLLGSKISGNGLSVLAAQSNGAQEHGRKQHNT